MSKSYRKSPFIAFAKNGDSEKKDKQLANRKFRRLTREALKLDKNVPIRLYEISEVYSFAKDGKGYLTREIINKHPELMRK